MKDITSEFLRLGAAEPLSARFLRTGGRYRGRRKRRNRGGSKQQVGHDKAGGDGTETMHSSSYPLPNTESRAERVKRLRAGNHVGIGKGKTEGEVTAGDGGQLTTADQRREGTADGLDGPCGLERLMMPDGDATTRAFSPSDGDTPDIVEARIEIGATKTVIGIGRQDWHTMEALGMTVQPGLVVALAWRRSQGKGKTGLRSSVCLVSYDRIDVPKHDWPTTWDGMVQHVLRGGYFRCVGTLRGGMDQAEVNRLFDGIDFDDLPWDEIDNHMTSIRAGNPIAADQATDSSRLAEALAGVLALQQWDQFSVFLNTQPREVIEGSQLSPARLAALAVIAMRPRQPLPPPPQWLLRTNFSTLRFNHLSVTDFVPFPGQSRELKPMVEDAIINRLLWIAPDIKAHPHYQLQNIREDLRLELNPRDIDSDRANVHFSATMVLPNGPWISQFCQGALSLGGFCTVAPTDLLVETELSHTDQQVLQSIRTALGVDNNTFRLLLDESLRAAFDGDVWSRSTTVKFTQQKGGKRSMEHVDIGSPESRLLITIDATSLLMARRLMTRLSLKLGPITVGLTLPQVPQQALRNALQKQEPATIRFRPPGTLPDTPVLLYGPLPKGTLPVQIVSSPAKMAELRRNMAELGQTSLSTRDIRFIGRYDRDRSPMFLYFEWSSAAVAQNFVLHTDRNMPQALSQLIGSLVPNEEKRNAMQLFSCNLLAEVLALADEKTLRALITHGQAHPCQPPPPPPINPPGGPPVAGQCDAQAYSHTGSAASGPDNPAVAAH